MAQDGLSSRKLFNKLFDATCDNKIESNDKGSLQNRAYQKVTLKHMIHVVFLLLTMAGGLLQVNYQTDHRFSITKDKYQK